MKIWSTFCGLFLLSEFAACYRILGLFPYPGKSHFRIAQALMIELSRRGHEVVVVSQYPLEKPIPRYTDLSLKGYMPQLIEVLSVNNMNWMVSRIMNNYLEVVVPFGEIGDEICDAMLKSDIFQNLWKSDHTFDIIFHEPFVSDCPLALNEKFKAPIIAITTSPMLPWNNDRFGNPDNPSYIPTLWMDFSDKMSFFERLENFVVNNAHNYYFKYKQRQHDEIVRKHFGDGLPPLSTYGNNMSLLLVNTYFSLSLARPYTPNVVQVGGLHITDPDPLPVNIEKFINESTHGVIYFSLGSMIKGHTFPQEKKEAFLKAFARLPQRVLWKWENDTMPGKPDNVMIQKWMPQFDILSHPNVKAFISHGGLLGTTEAVHCGVPMVVMPQYGDQHTNAKAVEANGGGVIMYLKEATEEKVYQSLKTVLEPEFRAKAKALSERFRDRPMSPMDTAIYWVEYVARHKGAPHMRTAAVDMPLYQYLLLDVLAFLAAILILFFYLSYKIACLFFRSLFLKKKIKQN